jgi:hypothetical protein
MAIRLPYETRGGTISEADTYMQLIEHLRLAAEAAYTLGHYKKANDDELVGQGFLGVGQMLDRTCKVVTDLATKGRFQ